MINLKKTDLIQKNIPAKSGFFSFSDKSKVLYFSKTSNLRSSITNFLTKDMKDKDILKLNSLTKNISYKVTSNLMDALIEEKLFGAKHFAEMDIPLWENHSYLGIDHKVPYLNIKEDTQKKLFYLGPFQNRFFLLDLFKAMESTFQYPHCLDEKFPCEKMNDDRCFGWCIKDKSMLDKMLLKSYLKVNDAALSHLQKTQNKAHKELKFNKAEEIKQNNKTIQKYYDLLKFLHVTKNLNYSDRSVTVKNGMITKIQHNDHKKEFPNIDVEYRNNELLAFNKNELAERRIVYNYIISKNLDLVNELYKNSVKRLDNFFDIGKK